MTHKGWGFFIHSKRWKNLLSPVHYCKMRFYLYNEVKIILYFQLLLYNVVLLQNGAYIPPTLLTQLKTECVCWNCPFHSWHTVLESLISSRRCSLKVFFLQDFIYWYLFLVSNALLRYCIVVCIFTAHILCIKAWMSACLILSEVTGGYVFECVNGAMVHKCRKKD